MIEAIFFDIDGTLISFETHKMTEALQNALVKLKENGIKLFIATGRHISEMNELEKYPYFDGYITLNGCYCYNENGPYFTSPISEKDKLTAIKLASKKIVPIALIDDSTMTVNYRNDYVIRAATMANVPIPEIQDPNVYLNREVYQLVLYCPAHEDEVILSQMDSLTASRWHPDFIDVTPKHIAKHIGIQETCRIYHLNIENCMAFGDGGNDIDMLKSVGYGIAMGNSSESVKQAAKETTLSCEEDGIIHTLKKYNLI